MMKVNDPRRFSCHPLSGVSHVENKEVIWKKGIFDKKLSEQKIPTYGLYEAGHFMLSLRIATFEKSSKLNSKLITSTITWPG